MVSPGYQRLYQCPQCKQQFTIYEVHSDFPDEPNQKGKCPFCGFYGAIDTGTNHEPSDFIPLSPFGPPWQGMGLGLTNCCDSCGTFLIGSEQICRACGNISRRRASALELWPEVSQEEREAELGRMQARFPPRPCPQCGGLMQIDIDEFYTCTTCHYDISAQRLLSSQKKDKLRDRVALWFRRLVKP